MKKEFKNPLGLILVILGSILLLINGINAVSHGIAQIAIISTVYLLTGLFLYLSGIALISQKNIKVPLKRFRDLISVILKYPDKHK
jgi:membrane-bound ClpP family serine protease